MKALRDVCRVAGLVFSVAAVVLFFTTFANLVLADGTALSLNGAQLAFGAKVTVGDATADMARSADLWLNFFLAVIAVLCGAVGFKSRGSSIASPCFALAGGIYMLVVSLSKPSLFLDLRPLSVEQGITSFGYGTSVYLTCVAFFLAALCGFGFILARNYVEVMESRGKKRFIHQIVIGFLRDYKGELKRIVWPDLHFTLKNTGVVLIMCLIVGVFIWILDFGLSQLLNLILGIQ